MNIFKTYVLRNLKNNRVRTIMTIAGIMLSVALVTAVIEGGFSGLEYLRNIMKETYGNHHGYAFNLDLDTEYDLISDDRLEDHAELETLGWMEVGSFNSTKPYLLVKGASGNIRDFLNINIIQGHFPENANEILIPEHLATNGNVVYNIGDTITVTFGVRWLDGEVLPENTKFKTGEMLLDKGAATRTYTVCGIMERLSYHVEDYICPGYTAIVDLSEPDLVQGTFDDEPMRNRSVVFRVKDPTKYNDFAIRFVKEHPGTAINKNSELVALYGGMGSKSVMLFLNGFIILLISLILFGSISLVYNSFSISINERTRQIGILKSVGATKKQIRKTVFYEAFFECITSVPLGLALGCIGMGATFWLLENAFTLFLKSMLGLYSETIKICIVINVPLLIVGVVVVLVSTLLSATIPALRASKVSPIDLVRQSADIKVKKNKVKGSKILTKFFGAEGMLASKNYSRNRKKYRATIVSLSVSIILFIAASSFCSYLTGATEMEFNIGNTSLIFYNVRGDMDPIENDSEMKELLLSAEDVRDVIGVKTIYSYNMQNVNNEEYPENLDLENMDEGEYLDYYYHGNADIAFIDDESFEKLLQKEDISIDVVTPGAKPAVAYNQGSYYTGDKNGNLKKVEYKFIEDEKIPQSYKIEWSKEYYVPDRAVINQVVDENGEVYCAFIDTDHEMEYWNLLTDDARYMLAEAKLNELLMKELHQTYDPASAAPVAQEAEPFSEEELELFDHVTFIKYSELTSEFNVDVIGITYDKDYVFSESANILMPYSAMDEDMLKNASETTFHIFSDNSQHSESEINKVLIGNGKDTSGLFNYDNEIQGRRMIGRIVSVFAYGFILLISLVSITNVFNTISTNVALRRREFAIFKSMGLSNKGVTKILNIECLIYGLKSVLIGIPLSIPITFAVYKVTNRAFSVPFSIPWYSIVIASVSVFIVVFVTMLYASGKIKKDNTIDALRNENT